MVQIPSSDLLNFCLELLACNGVRAEVAHHVAEGLVQASLRGVDSHGVRLLPHLPPRVEGRAAQPESRVSFRAHRGRNRDPRRRP